MVKARSDCYQDYKTIRQWAIRGFLPKKGEKGTPLWTNRHHQTAYLYFSPEQVEQATPEALKWFFQPERERRNDNARKNRKRKREQAEREQREREQAAMDAAISKAVTPLLKKQAELHEIICGLTEEVRPVFFGDRCLVIDTETTGLNPYEHEILECSIIDTKGEVLFHSYVKPCAEVWPEAQAINGIKPEMVKDASTISQLRTEINRVLSQASAIIGYNTEFDLAFLAANGIAVPRDVEIVDVMLLFAPIYGEWDEYHEDYRWQSLWVCAGHYGYDWNAQPSQPHDSLSDCRATLYCWQKMMEEAETQPHQNET